MKNFLKTFLAVLFALLIVKIVFFIFIISVFGNLASTSLASSSTVKSVPENAILDIDMSKTIIAEQTLEDDPFTGISFASSGVKQEMIRTVGILDATRALEEAAADPFIKFAYIRPDMASDISHLEEFRTALDKFRQSGKPVIAYIQTPTNAGFYLASVADRIYMSEYKGGMNMLIGINGRMIFLKDLLDRLGINMQLIRHGKYKSAGEMYIRNSASEENLEQNSVMIKGIWKEMASSIAGKVGISVDEFNEIIDNLELTDPQAFLDKGFVNELVSMNGMKEKLTSQAGVEKYSDVKSISLADYVTARVKDNFRTKDKIAVVYADGEIIEGRDMEEVAGKRFADIITDVTLDNSIKAVVLRVNSPGGSVNAASEIKDAVDALKAVKPVVASYGSYAASGGYWISAGCDYIFSDATTLTGSIGVFGIIPDFGKTVRDLAHINVTAVPSNAHSDMFGLMRPLDNDEAGFIQKGIEDVYVQFTSLVSDGRNMPVEKVDELGQGRVWTGRDALENGLVDSIGTLKDAIDYTVNLVGCENYQIVAYPRPLTIAEQLMASFQPQDDKYLVSSKLFRGNFTKMLYELASIKEPAVYARLPYSLEIR